jgi:hypothetical protein
MTRYIHVYFQFEDPESHDDDYTTCSIVVKVVTLIQKAAADEIYNTSYCRVFHSILDQHLSTMAQGITSAWFSVVSLACISTCETLHIDRMLKAVWYMSHSET